MTGTTTDRPMPLFDAMESEQRKQQGIQQTEDNKRSLVEFARTLAVRIALSRFDRCCHMDLVQAALIDHNISERALGNAAGGLFRAHFWRWTGRRIKSQRAHAHANEIKVWELLEEHLPADHPGREKSRLMIGCFTCIRMRILDVGVWKPASSLGPAPIPTQCEERNAVTRLLA